MVDQATATPAAGEASSIPAHIAGGEGALTPGEAARSLTDWRNKSQAGGAEPEKKEQQDGAASATPAQESEAASAAEDSDSSESHAEATQEAEAEALPPIKPPGSWTDDEKAEFATYPREAQEKIVRREQERERKFTQRQQEAATQLKGVSAKEQAAEQARQQYEAALPQVLAYLQTAQAGEFGDIKSIDDVERMSVEDPLKFNRWQAHQMKVGAIENEVKQAQQRQADAHRQNWSEFSRKEDAGIIERMPELADKAKQTEVADKVVSMLEDAGIAKGDFFKAWNGEAALPVRHRGMQEILAKAALYELGEAKKAKLVKAAADKPLPPVQRPGAGKPANAGAAQQIQALEKQLANASGIRAARIGADITALRRKAAS